MSNGVRQHQLNLRDAQIKIVDGCNSKCLTCDIWKISKVRLMSVIDYRRVLEELADFGLKSVCLTGGEPLLHPELVDICRLTKEAGVGVVINTNGLLLGKRSGELVENVDEINVSIDGWEEKNDEIRGVRGYFESATSALLEMKGCDSGVKLRVVTTLIPGRMNGVDRLLGWCGVNGIEWSPNLLDDKLYFLSKTGVGKMLNQEKLDKRELARLLLDYKRKGVIKLSRPVIRYVADFWAGDRVSFGRCVLGLRLAYVDTDSNFYGGCWVLPPLGNLRQSRLKMIVEGEDFERRLRQMKNMDCPSCSCGFNINVEREHRFLVWGEKIRRKLVQ